MGALTLHSGRAGAGSARAWVKASRWRVDSLKSAGKSLPKATSGGYTIWALGYLRPPRWSLLMR